MIDEEGTLSFFSYKTQKEYREHERDEKLELGRTKKAEERKEEHE